MYIEDRKYSILALIFRTISLVSVVISLILFIFYNVRIVYRGVMLGICSIPLLSSILALIFEHISNVRKDIVYKIGLLIFDIIFMLFGLVSLFFLIIYII